MIQFIHDGSEIDSLVRADWLDDQGRHEEAEEIRSLIETGPDECDWFYEYVYVVGGGVGGVVGGGGGVVGGGGGVGGGVVVGGVGGGVVRGVVRGVGGVGVGGVGGVVGVGGVGGVVGVGGGVG